MVVLIILNIILIISLVFLVLYLLKNKNNIIKNINVNNVCDKIENEDNKQNNKLKPERVFVGRFVTDEEYQQITKSRKSDISILLDEVDREYEHLKELNK